jgi:hypothetical protein
MKGYLIALGVAIIMIGVVGGALYLSASYDTYQIRLHALGGNPDAPITMLDVAKWQLAEILGGGMIFGGLILGSLLMGMGWIGKMLEQIYDALPNQLAETASSELVQAVAEPKT